MDSAQEKLLRGEGGESRQLAMETLTKVGDTVGVDSPVPIKSAQRALARVKGDAAELVVGG